jgi:hypothetical protein
MSSRFTRRSGVWLDRGVVLARPVFYGPGWMVRDGVLFIKTGARSRSGALKAVRRLVGNSEVIVLGPGGSGAGCFYPDYKLGTKCWEFEVVTFRPGAKCKVSSDA